MRRLLIAALCCLALAACQQLEALLGPDQRVVIEGDFSEGSTDTDTAALLQQSEAGIRSRLEAVGLEVRSIRGLDKGQIELVISSGRSRSSIERLLGAQGRVEVRLVDTAVSHEALDAGTPPPGRIIMPMADGSGSVAVHRLGGLDGPRAVAATANRDEETFQPSVIITFDPEGNTKSTAQPMPRSDRTAAIILDDTVLDLVEVPDPLQGEKATIPGGATSESAQDLAVVLDQEPLPVAFAVVSMEPAE